MSNLDWDSKTVIGQKAKAPKVTRNTSDLNGALLSFRTATFGGCNISIVLTWRRCSRTCPSPVCAALRRERFLTDGFL